MSASTLLGVLVTAEEAAEEIGPEPVIVGIVTFVVLALALFLVTRLNKDR
ncbi:MAG: hypothetical protein MUC45_04395 [Actinomycetia bacterium]|jgi:hypothetical protein|nr:hypothetical protein [Actinomycetes bacterium]